MRSGSLRRRLRHTMWYSPHPRLLLPSVIKLQLHIDFLFFFWNFSNCERTSWPSIVSTTASRISALVISATRIFSIAAIGNRLSLIYNCVLRCLDALFALTITTCVCSASQKAAAVSTMPTSSSRSTFLFLCVIVIFSLITY